MKHLLDLVGKFHKAHLLVVGDLMLDRFVWGDVERIS
ncbi:MAG: D-glycero-beta-D-manno-heptose-7-phosphate kinase, partial [Deltaproteobacteria bacterium]|nr:D-glycero-beta-D-manno-heptose-7-phosphate kinase [Deltaproteobacteria bacterium]